MTRQYIGARYVPKFFVDENGNSNWRDNIPYEALTIVMYLGNSYTSKKPVPVGVQITDTEYWALTGNYNGQVEEYRRLVETITSERTIFIGDSYGVNNGGWIDQLADTNLIKQSDVIKLAQGGIGFHDDGYLTLLQNASISDPNSITRIVVCGGANDHEMTESSIGQAILRFVTYAKAKYPNAKLYLGHIGWSTNATLREKYTTITIPGYKACNKYGMVYLNGVEYCLHYYGYFSDDGIHPSNFGCKDLARYIMQALITGEVSIYWPSPLSTTKWQMQNNEWVWYTNIIGDEVEVVTNDCNLTFDNTTINGNTDHAIGLLNSTDFIYGYTNPIRNYRMVEVLVNGTEFTPCIIGIRQTGINRAEFTMKFVNTLNNVTSIKIPNLAFNVKLLFC